MSVQSQENEVEALNGVTTEGRSRTVQKALITSSEKQEESHPKLRKHGKVGVTKTLAWWSPSKGCLL